MAPAEKLFDRIRDAFEATNLRKAVKAAKQDAARENRALADAIVMSCNPVKEEESGKKIEEVAARVQKVEALMKRLKGLYLRLAKLAEFKLLAIELYEGSVSPEQQLSVRTSSGSVGLGEVEKPRDLRDLRKSQEKERSKLEARIWDIEDRIEAVSAGAKLSDQEKAVLQQDRDSLKQIRIDLMLLTIEIIYTNIAIKRLLRKELEEKAALEAQAAALAAAPEAEAAAPAADAAASEDKAGQSMVAHNGGEGAAPTADAAEANPASAGIIGGAKGALVAVVGGLIVLFLCGGCSAGAGAGLAGWGALGAVLVVAALIYGFALVNTQGKEASAPDDEHRQMELKRERLALYTDPVWPWEERLPGKFVDDLLREVPDLKPVAGLLRRLKPVPADEIDDRITELEQDIRGGNTDQECMLELQVLKARKAVISRLEQELAQYSKASYARGEDKEASSAEAASASLLGPNGISNGYQIVTKDGQGRVVGYGFGTLLEALLTGNAYLILKRLSEAIAEKSGNQHPKDVFVDLIEGALTRLEIAFRMTPSVGLRPEERFMKLFNEKLSSRYKEPEAVKKQVAALFAQGDYSVIYEYLVMISARVAGARQALAPLYEAIDRAFGRYIKVGEVYLRGRGFEAGHIAAAIGSLSQIQANLNNKYSAHLAWIDHARKAVEWPEKADAFFSLQRIINMPVFSDPTPATVPAVSNCGRGLSLGFTCAMALEIGRAHV
jgi:hypothetical protein